MAIISITPGDSVILREQSIWTLEFPRDQITQGTHLLLRSQSDQTITLLLGKGEIFQIRRWSASIPRKEQGYG